ncbi:MAG TPA: S8 family serine peptidase [Flavisolibacter sp.]
MRRVRSWILFALTLVVLQDTAGQIPSRYLISFRDKATSPFSLSAPASFLSPRSIERRTRFNIPLDSTDLPVTPRYLDSLRAIPTVEVISVSKWMNQVAIQTSDPTALQAINQLTFVKTVQPIAARSSGQSRSNGHKKFGEESTGIPALTARAAADFYNYGASFNQVHLHNGEFLHNLGLRGQNMVIGLLDAGYQNYLTVKAFDSVRANGQVLGTHDFVRNEQSVNEDDAHGMYCFSTIAANIPGQFVGTSPKSLFYLFRTEDAASEYPVEEHNWVCGAEKLDSAGGDLISSSLGYYDFDAPFNTPLYDHTYSQMNGNTTTAAIGADLAAKKGILVVNSAGNEGNKTWHYIITPADGDSVLAVGAVNSSGEVAAFSSYGPSSDGQVKPDLASVGVQTVIQGTSNAITTGNGTSFAAPNLAGLVACLWQGFPEFNNMAIIAALRASGSIANAPNDRIGYGIPDVKKALLTLLKDFTSVSGTLSSCKTTLTWTSKDVSAMKYEIERRSPGDTAFTKIAERQGEGLTFSNRTYQLSDALINTKAGVLQYRIKQVVDTASATAIYLDTVTINLQAACVPVATPGQNAAMLMPNPARGTVSINIVTTQAVPNLQIVISDLLGKVVVRESKSKGAGQAILPVSIHHLARGTYHVRIYDNGKLLTTLDLLKL